SRRQNWPRVIFNAENVRARKTYSRCNLMATQMRLAICLTRLTAALGLVATANSTRVYSPKVECTTRKRATRGPTRINFRESAIGSRSEWRKVDEGGQVRKLQEQRKPSNGRFPRRPNCLHLRSRRQDL